MLKKYYNLAESPNSTELFIVSPVVLLSRVNVAFTFLVTFLEATAFNLRVN
jgi:hypothetical protein